MYAMLVTSLKTQNHCHKTRPPSFFLYPNPRNLSSDILCLYWVYFLINYSQLNT